MKIINLGRYLSLEITARPSAFVSLALLWAVLGTIDIGLLDLPIGAALAGGFVAALLHYLSEFAHQGGHAFAARKTGHPMLGLRYWWVLGTSIYPPDEGELPDSVHLRRALGGAPFSLVVTILALIAVTRLPPASTSYWVAVFMFIDNLLVFTLGAFLPLGFTDGSTLLRIWRKRRSES